ncbi:hypothetical protein [Streptomyces prasinopilosus]|uniref:hypothetical protein n=1 Tax=Streptomyces prasinopilosus TaxID=67344 RepID=UPI000A77735C
MTGSDTRTGGAAGTATVTATVPPAERFGCATRLRSRTRGCGTFTARPTGYAPAPEPAPPPCGSRYAGTAVPPGHPPREGPPPASHRCPP